MGDLKTRLARVLCDTDEAGGDNWEEDQFWYMTQADAVLLFMEEELRAARARG